MSTNVKDRRESESWLHDALELSFLERFQLRKGGERDPALIVHGQRSGAHPDFAMLDANRKLILVELKTGEIRGAGMKGLIEQVHKYVQDYRRHPLADLAKWYCEHGVDVNTRFGYRGKEYVISRDGHDYGRLNRWALGNLERYREPLEGDGVAALDVLIDDYRRHVGKALDGVAADARLEVDRCILIAEKWPEGSSALEIDGAKTELWTYTAPAMWVQPSS